MLDGYVDTEHPQFVANMAAMKESIEDLKKNIETVRQGGGAKAVTKHLKKQKLLVRDRVTELLDPGSPFLELSQMAGHGLYGKDHVPSAGILTGIGMIHGRLCMIVGNDATTKGGTYYPMTVKKHLRA